MQYGSHITGNPNLLLPLSNLIVPGNDRPGTRSQVALLLAEYTVDVIALETLMK
jgi:hypothetical protein